MLALCYATLGRVEPQDKLRRLLEKMLDESGFLSDYGVRSLSKYHSRHPYTYQANAKTYVCRLRTGGVHQRVFGGNSNWRGPIWFPVNYLLIESLQKFHHYLGDDFTGSSAPPARASWMNLWEVAAELSQRLISIFQADEAGWRPVNGGTERFQTDPHWRDHILFYEYFHGDNGAGLGASHQTGWTGLVAKLIQQQAEYGTGKPVLE
jgi:hypothetical protein